MISLEAFPRQFRGQFRAHGALYVLAGFYLGFAVILQKWVGFTIMWNSSTTFMTYGSYMLLLAGLLAAIAKTVAIMMSANPDRPTEQLVAWVNRVAIETPRLANGMHATVLFFLVFGVFATLKSAIPSIVPFTWDAAFYEMDRPFFGGATAWEAWSLDSISPLVFITVNFFYNLWIPIVIAFLTFFGFANSSPVRSTFITSSMVTFVLCGSLLAILFSSAGPCFYGQVVDGHNPYADHVAFLKALHEETGMVWAVYAQELLWNSYSMRFDGAVSGISAMPSLHVAFAVLMALASWRVSKALGIFMIMFLIMICIGSVILAWHYAVDTVLGGAAAALIWFAVSACFGVACPPHPSWSPSSLRK